MINLYTPLDIMTRELLADKDKSYYWLKKKYEQVRNELLVVAKRDKCNKISEVFGSVSRTVTDG